MRCDARRLMSLFQPKNVNSAESALSCVIWNMPPVLRRSAPNVGVLIDARFAATIRLRRAVVVLAGDEDRTPTRRARAAVRRRTTTRSGYVCASVGAAGAGRAPGVDRLRRGGVGTGNAGISGEIIRGLGASLRQKDRRARLRRRRRTGRGAGGGGAGAASGSRCWATSCAVSGALAGADGSASGAPGRRSATTPRRTRRGSRATARWPPRARAEPSRRDRARRDGRRSEGRGRRSSSRGLSHGRRGLENGGRRVGTPASRLEPALKATGFPFGRLSGHNRRR